MIKDDREIEYEEHNLWLLDERFNFTQYIASDKVISSSDHKEPDLAIFYESGLFYRNGDNTITSLSLLLNSNVLNERIIQESRKIQ